MTETQTEEATRPAGADEFRAFLERIGEGQSEFARTLKRLGDDRTPAVILRHVQRLAAGHVRISGEMRVIMELYRGAGSGGSVCT